MSQQTPFFRKDSQNQQLEDQTIQMFSNLASLRTAANTQNKRRRNITQNNVDISEFGETTNTGNLFFSRTNTQGSPKSGHFGRHSTIQGDDDSAGRDVYNLYKAKYRLPKNKFLCAAGGNVTNLLVFKNSTTNVTSPRQKNLIEE